MTNANRFALIFAPILLLHAVVMTACVPAKSATAEALTEAQMICVFAQPFTASVEEVGTACAIVDALLPLVSRMQSERRKEAVKLGWKEATK